MSIVALLIVLFVLAIDGSKRNAEDTNSRNNAISQGKAWYLDSKGIVRSVSTGEPCYFHDVHKSGYSGTSARELKGAKTNTVYWARDFKQEHEDRVAESIRKDNIRMREAGKKYYYRRVPGWDRREKDNMILGRGKVDTANGKLIDSIVLERINGQQCWVIYYARDNWRGKHFENGTFDKRVISRDEYMKYYS